MTLPGGPYAPQTNPLMSSLDTTFAAVGALGVVPCSTAGTNIITLTPNANTPTISAYANNLRFSFIAANSSTGPVTLQVGSLAALKVFLPGGVTQAGAANIIANVPYDIMFNSTLDSSNGGWVIVTAGSNNLGSFGSVTAAATTTIGGITNDYIQVNGTAAITSFDSVAAGIRRTLEFTSSATLTNGVNLILPGGANIPTFPGDVVQVISEGSGVWRASYYTRGNAKSPTYTTLTGGSGASYSTPTGAIRLEVWMAGGGGGSGGSGTNGVQTNGSGGGTTVFSTFVCPGGPGGFSGAATGVAPSGGPSNAPSGGTFILSQVGSAGEPGVGGGNPSNGPSGGVNLFGGAAQKPSFNGNPGIIPAANTGAGASGPSSTAAVSGGAGGTAGAYGWLQISNPVPSFIYTIGSGGVAGVAGASGLNGAKGSDGVVLIKEIYY